MATTEGAVAAPGGGGGAELWFPLADVRLELLPADLRPSLARAERRRTPAGPADMVAFDHDRVRVEVLDPMGGAARDLSVKRFPVWGTAADLVEVLDLRSAGAGRYRGVPRGVNRRRAVVEGSQLLGQALVATGRSHPDRRAVSAHMVFFRTADPGQELEFTVEELSHGRSFSAAAVRVAQGGRFVAAGTFLLDAGAPEVVRHAAPPPAVPGPYESVPCDMSVLGRDIRVVEGAYDDDPDAPVGPPVVDAWVRYAEAPGDPLLNAALLAQFTGHMSIAAALRPHAGVGQRQAHRSLSTAVNAIALSLHAPVRADRWMLYHHRSTFAGGGMTHSQCRVHDEEGGLLASFAVDAMVRPMAHGVGAREGGRVL